MKIEEEIKQNKKLEEDEKLLVNILFTNNYLLMEQAKRFKKYGITSQQFNVLRILRGQHPNPATIKYIKERMLDKMSDASRIVEKLRVKGYVLRNICPDNRRNVDILITKQGMEILSKLNKANEEIKSCVKKLSVDEMKTLNSLLDKIRE